MTNKKQQTEQGFTIVELMVATIVFSVIMVVIASGVLHFTNAYYKGTYTSATQTTARTILSNITQNLQYGSGSNSNFINDKTSHPPDMSLCVGTYLHIEYKLGVQLTSSSPYGVSLGTRPTNGSCPTHFVTPPTNTKELLGPNMRITNLKVAQNAVGDSTYYTVSVGIAYGDDDLLCAQTDSSGTSPTCSTPSPKINPGFKWDVDGSTVRCKSGAGSQFCAVSHLTTEVVSRFQ